MKNNKRILLLSMLFISLLNISSCDNPNNNDANDPLIKEYWPLSIGNEWNYNGEIGQAGTRNLYVEGTYEINNISGWLIKNTYKGSDGGTHISYMVWEVSKSGWWMHGFGDDSPQNLNIINPPLQLLSANPTAGETYLWSDGDRNARITLVGEESLNITSIYDGPALKMLFEDLGSTPYNETFYLAKEIGLVKSVSINTNNGFFFGAATLNSYNF